MFLHSANPKYMLSVVSSSAPSPTRCIALRITRELRACTHDAHDAHDSNACVDKMKGSYRVSSLG